MREDWHRKNDFNVLDIVLATTQELVQGIVFGPLLRHPLLSEALKRADVRKALGPYMFSAEYRGDQLIAGAKAAGWELSLEDEHMKCWRKI